MATHIGRPWFNSFLEERFSISMPPPLLSSSGLFSIPADLPGKHILVCGNIGSGKTRFSMAMLKAQLALGCSAVVLDFKKSTIQEAASVALEAGVKPENITVLWPDETTYGIPGWNFLNVSQEEVIPVVQEFVDILRASDTSGSRMWVVLRNAAIVIAAQRLSLLELKEFLIDDTYRKALLERAKKLGIWQRFEPAHDYWDREFARLPPSEQKAAVVPVSQRLSGFLDTDFLRALFCATHDTLDLAGLWKSQRVILAHMDTYSLGMDGTGLLMGMFAKSLYKNAMRRSGAGNVVLMLDELRLHERYMGTAITDTLAVARSQGLRLILAAQFLGQLSQGLQSSMLALTAVQAFFQLSDDDAGLVSKSLGRGVGAQEKKIEIQVDSQNGTHSYSYFLLDEAGNKIDIKPIAWEMFHTVGQGTLASLRVLIAGSPYKALFVNDPLSDTMIEIGEFLKNVNHRSYRFHGPTPMYVSVTFPRPKVVVLDRQSEAERTATTAKVLHNLLPQHAVIRTSEGNVAMIKAADIHYPEPLPDLSCYLKAGQTYDEIRGTYRDRKAEIDKAVGRLPTNIPIPDMPEVNDGVL